METISIFQQTQKSYAEAVYSLLGRGRNHAMLLYAEWFRHGQLDGLWASIEPQAIKLVHAIIEATNFVLPELAGEQLEGETAKFLLRFSDGLESESVLIGMDSGI